MKKEKIMSLITGICFTGLGLYFFANSAEAIKVIIFTSGIVLLVASVFEVVYFFTNKESDDRYLYLAGAFIDAILGLLFLFNVVETAEALAIFVGIWVIVRGIIYICVTFKYREFPINKGLLYLIAALNVLFGIFIILNPTVFDVAIVIVVGVYLVFVGILALINAFI